MAMMKLHNFLVLEKGFLQRGVEKHTHFFHASLAFLARSQSDFFIGVLETISRKFRNAEHKDHLPWGTLSSPSARLSYLSTFGLFGIGSSWLEARRSRILGENSGNEAETTEKFFSR